MKNAIISVIIFFGLLIGIFFLNNSVIDLCDSIKYKTDDMEVILLNEDYDEAYDKAVELLSYLQENDFIASIYTNHQDFDALRHEAVRLCLYISKNDIGEAYSSLHFIKYSAQTIKHLQSVTLGNIF
ncbi:MULTISPECIES: DUF4363 family protein [Clostridium]|uniref:DUF4363 family protein n=1 Tax=Clostridium butyricum TaxID=1492 RepID=A0A2S7F4U7_CLOBU|nr:MULTISPECIES: DUF4363 family protein [Clostridium]AXB83904.1 DUF4363 family protein [Clostridium butyricum]EMU55706.1 hypothetical protein CBDKU1_04340 [Clostridium butyricum DKU-01]ENZ35599.1 hypothetical protein HMPREF1084_00180 [Clostridium butyricum 60E.3]KHD16417.1 hypothetical protein OA81_04600 [Clostridium butyricum]KIU06792.1 hypothetical protein SC08_Contig83orf00589 [Clostridium butyricum]